jgi:hypothetical protein
MHDFIIEVIINALFETLPRLLGIFTKWIFYLGRKSLAQINEEKGNITIGIIVMIFIFSSIIYFCN